jgi:hypothetical protein
MIAARTTGQLKLEKINSNYPVAAEPPVSLFHIIQYFIVIAMRI